jgi:hypothetical protein
MDPFGGISAFHKIPPYTFSINSIRRYFITTPLTFLYLSYQYPFNTTLKKKMGVNEKCG